MKNACDLKIIMVGDANVGKTSLVLRYTKDNFNEENLTTLGVAHIKKQWGPYNIALWDTAGEERFVSFSTQFYRNAGAAILVYDISSHRSLEVLRTRYIPLLPDDCLKVVVGAKLDRVIGDHAEAEREVSESEAEQFAENINPSKSGDSVDQENNWQIPFFETSSKTGAGVKETFECIFERCLSSLSDKHRMNLNDSIHLNEDAGDKKRCCTVL